MSFFLRRECGLYNTRILMNSCFFLLLLLWSHVAQATPNYVQYISNATAVFAKNVELSEGEYTFRVTNLSGSAPDTIMHLWDPSTKTELKHNDDSPSGGLHSEFTVNIGTAGTYTVIIYAYSDTAAGNCDLEITNPSNPTTTITGISFGGAKRWVDADSRAGNGIPYDIETTFRPAPEGMTDSILLGVQCSSGVLVAYEDDSGVGRGERIVRNDLCYVVVSPYVNASNGASAQGGSISLYVNDYRHSDVDNDGLGSGLEALLGTCDDNVKVYPHINCSEIFSTKDTDRDGLSDKDEVFGIDRGTKPQLLPRWGAIPTQKDMFIEVDTYTPSDRNTLTVANMRAVQDYFSKGSASNLRNPNGQPGIRLHFDVGRHPPAGPNTPASDFVLYGDWGGANEGLNFDNLIGAGRTYESWAHLPYDKNYFAKERRHVFRHLSLRGIGGPNARSVVLSYPQDRIFIDDVNSAETIAHELGHSVGLEHYGHASWSEGVNCNPAYLSIMNYAYNDAPGFSQHDETNSKPLNPSYLKETEGLGSFFSGTNIPLFLTSSPFLFPISDMVSCNGTCGVDWNRDAQFTSSSRIRTMLTRGDSCPMAYSSNSQEIAQAAISTTFKGSPKLIRHGEYLYLFYVKNSGEVFYRRAKIPLAVNGQGLYGSCDPGKDKLNTHDCVNWLAEVQVTGLPSNIEVDQIDAISTDPDAPSSGKIILLYSYKVPGLSITLYQMNWKKHATFDASTGALTWNASNPAVAIETTPIVPELSWIRLGATHFPEHAAEPLAVAVFYRISSDYHWLTFRLSTETWTHQTDMKDQANVQIKGAFSPGVAIWPNRHSTNAQTCGVFPSTNNTMRLYCYDPTSNRWVHQAQAFALAESTRSKPNLIYHPVRFSNGTSIDPNGIVGQFWLSYTFINAAGNWNAAMWRSQTLGGTTLPTPTSATAVQPMFIHAEKRSMHSNSLGNMMMPNTSITIYVDDKVAALKGAWVGRHSGSTIDKLRFFPFMDGTYDTQLKTGNDFRIMERLLCHALHKPDFSGDPGDDADLFCGTSAKPQSYWGY